MAASASEWNAKYRAQAEEPQAEPAGFVRDLLPLLPLGPALDLACGTGRHTLLLASRHQPVTAVDGSAVALDVLERRAGGIAYSGRRNFRSRPESNPFFLGSNGTRGSLAWRFAAGGLFVGFFLLLT